MNSPRDPQRIKALFLQASQIDNPKARRDFLVKECGGNEDLLELLDKMFNAEESSKMYWLDEIAEQILRMDVKDVLVPIVSEEVDVRPEPLEATAKQMPQDSLPKTTQLALDEHRHADEARDRKHERLGAYKILELIGQGGMGLVYRAEQLEPVRRHVALKIIKPGMDSRQVVARFEAERQALSLMNHPNIASVLDAGTTPDGRPYFVMELVKGQPITKYCDENSLSTNDRLLLIRDVCLAVQHAHQKGIIHRDIKPSNVLVTNYDELVVPKVIDFGVAKAITQSLTDKTLYTGFGQIVGTLEYMSPEQSRVNQLDIDTRSDVYSLGVLLYELLVGQTPIDRQRLRSASFEEMLRIIREENPPTPSKKLSSSDHWATIAMKRNTSPLPLSKLIQGEIDWIVMKAIAKDRNERYDSAKELAADIDRYLSGEQVLACPPTLAYRARKFAKRNRAFLVTVSSLMAVLLLGIAGTAGQAMRAMHAETELQKKLVQSNADRDLANRLREIADEQATLAKDERQRADAEAKRAQEQERIAYMEATSAMAIRAFLENDLLAMVAPNNQQQGELMVDRDITVRTLLDRASVRLNDNSELDVRSRASLHNTLGSAYGALGFYTKAESHLNRSLEFARQYFGAKASETLRVSCSLATALTYREKFDASDALLKETLSAILESQDVESKEYLQCLNAIMFNYYRQQRFSEARDAGEKALIAAEALHGRNSAEYLGVLGDLASQYQGLGDTKRCVTLREQVYQLSAEVLGDDSLQTNLALEQLGTVYFTLGDLPKALNAYERSWPLLERAYDPEHPELLNNRANRSRILVRMNRFEEARPLAEETMSSVRNRLGTEHFLYRFMMLVLTELYIWTGQFDKASELIQEAEVAEATKPFSDRRFVMRMKMSRFDLLQKQNKEADLEIAGRETLDLMKKELGSSHEDTIAFMGNFGVFLHSKNRSAEAIELFDQVYEDRVKNYGPNAIPSLNAAYNRACALFALGKKSDAYYVFEEVLVAYESLPYKSLDAETHLTPYARNVWLDTDLPDRFQRAEKLFDRLISVYERHYGPHSLEVIRAVGQKAQMMYYQSRIDEAIAFQLASLQQVEEAFKKGATTLPAKILSIQQMADLFRQCEKPEEAEPLYGDLVSLLSNSSGAFHRDTQSACDKLVRVLMEQDKLNQAERFLRERFKLADSSLHPDAFGQLSIWLADVLEQKALRNETADLSKQDFEECIELLKTADANYENTPTAFGSSQHRYLMSKLRNLAVSTNQWELVEYWERKRFASFEKASKAVHPIDIALFHRELLTVAAAQRRFNELPDLIQKCEQAIERLTPTYFEWRAANEAKIRVWLAAGDYDRAAQAAESFNAKADQVHPNDVIPIRFLHAEARYLLGDSEGARKSLDAPLDQVEQLSSKTPAHLNSLSSWAELLIADGRLDEAASALKRSAETQSNGTAMQRAAELRLQLCQARLLIAREQVEPASEILRSIIATRPYHQNAVWVKYAAKSLLGEISMRSEPEATVQESTQAVERLLSDGYQGMEAWLPIVGTSQRNRDYQLYSAAKRLTRFYQTQGDPAKAAEWQKIEAKWFVAVDQNLKVE